MRLLQVINLARDYLGLGVIGLIFIGIISKLSTILAETKVGICALSTYDTDYILVKKENLEDAKNALREHEYIVE